MSLHHMLRAAVQQQAGGPSDPYFEYNTLLLTGDGTNGAQNNTFLDSSTNNFTITRNGNTTQGSFSPYGNLWSNYFDGTGDWLSLPANQTALQMGTGAYTIEGWVYLNAYDTYPQPLFESGNATNSLGVLVTGTIIGTQGAVTLNKYGVGEVIGTASGIVPLNTWTHIAAVRTSTGSNDTRIYVNGVLQATGTDANNWTVSTNPTIGSLPAFTTYDVNGYLSNIRVVKGTAVYTSNFTPSTTPLTAVSGTSLLTCQSNRFIDNSSNNFTLTVNGNTSVQRFSPFNPTAPYSTATIGGSGYFDGTGDYLSAASNAAFDLGSSNFTIEAFIYPLSFTNGYSIASRYAYISPTAYGWVLRAVNATTIRFVRGNDVILDGTTTINLNAWNHVAVSRSGSTLSIYVNGVRAATATGISNFSDATSVFQSGATNTSTDYVNGYISNLRVVKGSAVYDPSASTLTVPTSPLTAITNTSLLTSFTNAGIPDAAMMNNLETVGNAQVSTSVVKYGTGSLKFDGTGDYLTWPALQSTTFGTGDFTVEFWINFSNSSGSSFYVIDTRNSGQTTNWAVFRPLGNTLDWFNGTTQFTGPTFTTTGTWTHVAYSRSGTSLRLFVNGTLTNTFTDSANYSTAPTIAYIGSRYSAAEQLNGYIDDLRITKGIARYTANFTPPAQALPTY